MLSMVVYCSLYTVFKYTLGGVKLFMEAPLGQLKSIIIHLVSLSAFSLDINGETWVSLPYGGCLYGP